MRNFFKKIILFSLMASGFIFFPHNVFAATFRLLGPDHILNVGEESKITAEIDPAGESINAVEGDIAFDGQAQIVTVSSANSIISWWMQAPEVKDGKIVFAGIIPGGFSGVLDPYSVNAKPGQLFTFTVRALGPGVARISPSNLTVLANDGKGAKISVSAVPIILNISDSSPAAANANTPPAHYADKQPPTLSAERIQNSTLFNGRWAVVFNGADAESGINHYEIAETQSQFASAKDWKRAVSPYVLQNQSSNKWVLVAAVDNSGNKKIVSIAPVTPPPFNFFSIWSILGVIGIGLVIFLIKKIIRNHARDL